ncbi:MAG: glycosyltransferase [Bacteroidota bacterium]|nr:glycosyltransferase [Bacteroidota bacterium]
MSNNTLYITFDGLSDPLGQSQILPYVVALAQQGYSITVLSCEKPSVLKTEKQGIEDLIKGLSIEWQYIEYNEQGNFITRYNYVKQLQTMAEQVVATKKISLTHCRSYLSALIGLKLKKQKGIPFLFDMRGFWADERVDGGIWKKNNPLHYIFYSYFKFKEKQFLRHADFIVTLTNASLRNLMNKFPGIPINEKAEVIPCCTNMEKFDRSKTQKAHLPNGVSENDFLLIYTGSIGTWYCTKEMIDCALAWKEFIPNIKLLILTKDKNELPHILNSYSTSQKEIISVECASYKDVPSYLALAKAAIYFIKPVFSKIASSPTKMAECWAMDLPIITNQGIGDNDLYFNEHKGGVLLSEFTDNEYKKSAQVFLEFIKKNANYRDIAITHFNNKNAASTYLNIYNALTL